MKHPLENYRKIEDIKFIEEIENRLYNVHYHNLDRPPSIVSKDEDNKRLRVSIIEDNSYSYYVTVKDYFSIEYQKLEKEARTQIEDACQSFTTDKQEERFIKRITAELQGLQNSISKLQVNEENEYYQSNLMGYIESFKISLQVIHEQHKKLYKGEKYENPKIKWLGTAKQLGTLFFDLLHGQRGTTEDKDKPLKPLISAEKGVIMHFLNKSFVYSDGSEIKLSTLDGILTNSENKDDERADGERIELNYPPPTPSKNPS